SALEQNRAEEADESAGGNLRRVVGSGAVVPGHRVVVVRPETAEECAPGEVGEVWVAGPSVARGYWNRPEETERTFRAALSDADGGAFLRTGDLGFLRGGELFVTGRLKDLVIVRGVNHYPQDIELTAERSHEILRPGCGAAFSIEEGGEERLVVVQEIDLKRRHEAERAVERIRAAVAEGHEVEPFAVALVRPGGVPKTSSGKIQRALCRAKFLAGELEIVSEWRAPAVAVDNLVAPTPPAEMLQTASQIEAWLVAQLASRLGVEAAEIDVNRPVTRYGLDSLTAIELMHGIEVALGVTLPMVSFLQSPSVAQLAAQALVQLASNASPVPPMAVNVAAETSAEHALSYGQRSLWFLHELAPDSPAYNITSAMRLRAALDIPALRRAFLTLVERHPSLRTTFAAPHGEPVQRVEERAEVCFAEVDASMWGEAELYSRLREQAHLPFDLERGPVFRVSLFARGAQEYILLVNVHHIVADFWSLAVLMHELGVLYAAEKTGNAAALAPVASHYSDYVCWQAGMLAGPAGERLWSYWQGQLAGELPVMNLPTDHPRPPVQTYRGSSHSFSLTEELTRALKELARAHDATLHTTLLAAFAALLHRHTGQTDLLVGTPTAGRNRAELAGVVGYFVNPVVLRADASQNPTFAEFLARVRSTTLSAFEHQDYPFAHLVERLQPARDPSRSPLVQVMFALQKAQLQNREGLAAFALGEDGSAITLGELEIESVRLEQRVSQFDLTLMMAEGEGALSGSLQYSTDLFDAGTIARLAGHFRTLLASVVADPEQRIAELPLLTEAETRQLLSDWNDNAADYPRDVCVHKLFERRAALAPDALAAECARGALTYRDLDERANRVARVLRAHGVGAESIVGVLVNRSGEMLAALLGVLKAGGAYLPIDPAYPAERIAFMLRDSGAAVLLTEAELAAELPAHGARVVLLDAERDSLARESCAPLAPAAKSENLAYVIYTSGSTGRPKGVAVTHRSLMNLVNWHRSAYNVTPEDRATQLAGTGFDASVWELWPYLTAGASIHLSDEETRLAPALLRDWLVERRATVTFLPTPLAESVLSLEWPQDAALKFMLTGGDRLTLYPTPAHAFQLVNHYGPTEYTVVTTAARVPARLEAESAPPIGRPVSNTRGYLLDARMQTVPVGVVGELYVGGDGLARGYLNRPELTAERFVPDPFSTEPGARLYRTGDLARFLADGQIEYVGRSDEQVKIRGFRIELGEIEAALAQHEQLREVVVVARQEGGEKRLVAYVTTHEGAERTTASELRGFLKSRLPDYMIPSAFVVLDAMPLTPNGKVDRRELPAPESASAEGEGTHVAPRTPVEEVLAGIWAQVLGRTRVGATDNFFELGGHSLLATQVMSRVRESFQVELPLRALFEEPTVAGLAAVVESAARVEAGLEVAPPRVVSRDGELPLSFAQQRLWFLDQLEPGRAFYNIPAAVEMKGDLNVAALEQALNEVVRRHESLRTVFERVEGRPVPVVLGEQTLALPLTDLRHLSECDREVETLRLMTEEAQRPFDLAKGPLVRAGLARVADDGHVLLITMHHVASDGWSMDVLVREVGALYEAFSEGRPSPLAELPIQYADFAAWQRERLQGEFLEKQLAYWREQLAGAPAALELPTDRPRPAVQSFLGATETLELDFELGERLKSLSRQEGATLFMTLLAGF
ncbi:MAG TPA: amino acid adenylation domain-containing protein, partial [Pyrinomonadaceae bacterium]|nr:amino acid adenylation domain-containing protein [Pyrinomonadaceae bacterium]